MKNILVVPTYNERKNIEKFCLLIFSVLPDIHILVVDDNSPDKTAIEIKNMQKKYRNLLLLEREKKEGLGRAYVDAFKFVLDDGSFDSLIMMDADFSHDPKYLDSMIKESQSNDLVIGSRYITGGGIEGWEFWRYLLSLGGNIYTRLITTMPVRDATAGFNLINLNVLKKIDMNGLESSGYAFQIELKYRLWKAGAKIKEIPIIFKNRLEGESKISNHIVREGMLVPWKLLLKR